MTRWSAVEDAQFGACGCAKSHVTALTHFLTQETAPWCLILEDDFEFVRPWGEFVESFNKLVAAHIEWDALLLTVALSATHGVRLDAMRVADVPSRSRSLQ